MACPASRSASYALGAPLTLRSGMTSGAELTVKGKARGFQAQYQDNFVGPAYFKVMGIGIVKGREFRAEDRRGGPVVVASTRSSRVVTSGRRTPRRAAFACRARPRPGYPGGDRRPSSATASIVRWARIDKPAIYEAYAQRVNQQRFAHVFVRTLAGRRCRSRAKWRAVLQAAGPVRVGRSSADEDARWRLRSCPAASARRCSAPWARSDWRWRWSDYSPSSSYSVSRRTAEIGMRDGARRDAAAVHASGHCATPSWSPASAARIGLGVAWFVTTAAVDVSGGGLSSNRSDDVRRHGHPDAGS